MKHWRWVSLAAVLVVVVAYEAAADATEIVYLQAKRDLVSLPGDRVIELSGSPDSCLTSWRGDTATYVARSLLSILRSHGASSAKHAFDVSVRNRTILGLDGNPLDISFMDDWFRIEVPAESTSAFIEDVIASNVGYAEPQISVAFDSDPLARRQPNDTLWPIQSVYLDLHRLSYAWAKTTGSSAIKVDLPPFSLTLG